jgi:hypothetical protein
MNLPDGYSTVQTNIGPEPSDLAKYHISRSNRCACGRKISVNKPACWTCLNMRTNYASPEEAQAAAEARVDSKQPSPGI